MKRYKDCRHLQYDALRRELLVLSILLYVAPCIFVESLQFINQRMHI